MGYDWFYFAKKAYALYPGVSAPVSGSFLAPHYARRRATRGPLSACLDAVVGLGFQAWIPLRAAKMQKKFGLDAAWRRRAVAIARARRRSAGHRPLPHRSDGRAGRLHTPLRRRRPEQAARPQGLDAGLRARRQGRLLRPLQDHQRPSAPDPPPHH
jgi:hypothetical protein